MFPIRDHNPSGRTPYVTYLLMAANIAIFLSYVSLFQDGRALNAFFFDFAAIPARIVTGDGLSTLATSMFLHGGWMHLAGNMLFLYIFGDNVEDEMGHIPYLVFYLATGLAAGLVHMFSAPPPRQCPQSGHQAPSQGSWALTCCFIPGRVSISCRS